MIRSWNLACQANSKSIFLASIVTDDLNPRMIDAKLFDYGPNFAGLFS